MRNLNKTYRRVFSGIVAGAAVLAANLLVVHKITESEAAEVADFAIPAAPAPIASVTAPDLDIPDLYDAAEFVVPVLNRPRLELPPPPLVDVEAIRASARAWLGDGVMAAPTDEIVIAAPDVATLEDLAGPAIDVPVLERPELPAPPPVR